MSDFRNLIQKLLEDDEPVPQNIGLALGSGATLGAAHVGVLKALDENNIRPAYVAGSSIGALVAALYAFGMPVIEIEEIALTMDWLDVSELSLSKMGLLSNDELGDLLDEKLGDVTFDQAEIPLAVVATDISTGDKVILSEGDVSEAVKASACIPGIFIPVEIDDRILVDGGLRESVPVSALRELGAEYIIAVDLKAYRKYRKPDDLIDIINNSLDIALTHLARVNTEQVDLMIQPKLEDFSRTDTEHAAEMIKLGYEAAIEMLKDFK
ncbi:MAG: patatin-like phospholipase family protein [Balneolaceae bacterium]|nr:patatin-like phospholipase family protein [Balneolaceae bacterium]